MPRSDVWQKFLKSLISTYHIKLKKVPELPNLYMICRYYGTMLPGVIAQTVPIYRFSSNRIPKGYFDDSIDDEYDIADTEEVLVRVDRTLKVQKAPFKKDEQICAVWQEMMLRYRNEKDEELRFRPRSGNSRSF